jgi:hypothetical protein
VFESVGRLSIMSEALRKRGREPEALEDSIGVREPKRFHDEEMQGFLHLLQLDVTLEDDEEEECAPSEELINGVIKSLEEEIGATCSSSYTPSISVDNSTASVSSSGQEGQTLDSDSGIDLCYLLEASDDELGIPPSPVLDLKDEVCLSARGTSASDLTENPDLKFLGENWHVECDFESYEQFVFDDAWDARQMQDYLSRDLVSQGTFYDGSISAPWRLEAAGGM